MGYDVLAESVALIKAGRAERVARLSRRRRFAAMAVDVAGDLAVTLFARRGVGRIWEETHVLVRRDGEWTWLGGGGSDGDQGLLADRPIVLPTFLGLRHDRSQEADPRVIAVSGSGGVLDGGDEPGGGPRRERWISHATLRVNAQVTAVQVAERRLVVPWHGRPVVVWSAWQPPRAVALDESGESRGEIQLPSTH